LLFDNPILYGQFNSMKDEKICKGCGKPLSNDEKTVVVITGQIIETDKEDDFESEDLWGFMHARCFLLAVGDPDAVKEFESHAA